MTTAVEQSLREKAAQRFTQLGWPTPRLEEWKYTNFAPVAKVEWRSEETPQPIESTATLSGRAVLELQFVNGRLTGSFGDETLGGAASTAFPSDLASIADWERNALVALNAMHTHDGARIDIAANAVVEGFIHLLFIGHGDGIWSHPRNVIVAGRGSQVTVVETYVGSGKYFTNAVTEIVAGDGAVVDHYRVQCESLDAFHYGHVAIRQERGSNVTSRGISIGGSLVRNEVSVALAGEGASVTLDGLFAGTGEQHLDNRTVVDHVKPHCESTQLYKGVLDQRARGIFDGRIIVRPDAQKTNSRQENRNLLLSESAVVDSRPNLEIHNDDVKCSHGSTIGQLDEEALFYLRSRGISEEEARGLMIYAFTSEIVDRMKIEPVAEQIRGALFRSMPERLPERRGTNR
ncbi:MAG: Fe-S cluster assembly protein SufD [Acidobacteriota bacterium]|jgi:Fe-S cluster assembly protein SufD|nr:Fe-S cluster assembly protein SufD [Acidobacteriota bacterium]